MPRRLVVPALFALTACTPTAVPFETPTRSVAPAVSTPLPRSSAPIAAGTASVLRSNASIARDFMALSFALESGTQVPRLTRFSGPITVRLSGQLPGTAGSDLSALLTRLRSEARIDIHQSTGGPANILIEGIPRAEINRFVPNAACFVAPEVSGLADYQRARRNGMTSWATMASRTKMTIFVPSDASPQETRDCLHEELAQALGPLNDLYSLSDSVFNDDNVHATLTDFDMLILRIYYDPMLQNGMTAAEVQGRLPYILRRLNPAGEGMATAPQYYLPDTWAQEIATALRAGSTPTARIRAAERAVALVNTHGVNDTRAGFSYFVLGRVTMAHSAQQSRRAFENADRLYAALPDSRLQRAFVATQLAAFALTQGKADTALGMVRPYLQTARDAENAALLATLMLLEAEALDLKGASSQARSVRLDSMGWARYGFGSEQAVQARLREIAALSPG